MRRIAVGLASLLGVGVLLATAGLNDPPFGAPSLDTADVGVVLSGDVDYLRARRAAELYRQGRVQWLLVTGSGVGGDNAVDLARVAVEQGVPIERIALERTSTSTRENVTEAAQILRTRAWRRAALITSASHMRRAVDAARKVAPEIEWVAAPVPDAGPRARVIGNRIQERLKWAWYAAHGWV